MRRKLMWAYWRLALIGASPLITVATCNTSDGGQFVVQTTRNPFNPLVIYDDDVEIEYDDDEIEIDFDD